MKDKCWPLLTNIVVPEYGDDVERVSATRSARLQYINIWILGTGVTQSNDVVFMTNFLFY